MKTFRQVTTLLLLLSPTLMWPQRIDFAFLSYLGPSYQATGMSIVYWQYFEAWPTGRIDTNYSHLTYEAFLQDSIGAPILPAMAHPNCTWGGYDSWLDTVPGPGIRVYSDTLAPLTGTYRQGELANRAGCGFSFLPPPGYCGELQIPLRLHLFGYGRSDSIILDTLRLSCAAPLSFPAPEEEVTILEPPYLCFMTRPGQIEFLCETPRLLVSSTGQRIWSEGLKVELVSPGVYFILFYDQAQPVKVVVR